MRLEKFTRRVSPATGKPYPRCQFVEAGMQCERTVYSDGLCWGHYRMAAPTAIDGRDKSYSERVNRAGR